MQLRTVAFMLAACVMSAPAQAEWLRGHVVGVIDGDSLVVLIKTQEIEVRMSDIDAPEKGQPFGKASKESLSELAFDRDVAIDVRTTDRFGRVVGRVYASGVDAALEQIRRGMAWVFRKYSNDITLLNIEQQARLTRRGLWADTSPLPPWEWRYARMYGADDASEP